MKLFDRMMSKFGFERAEKSSTLIIPGTGGLLRNKSGFADYLPLHASTTDVIGRSSKYYDTPYEQLRAYNQLVWINTCVRKIATISSGIPMVVKSKADDEILWDHPLAALLNAPNEYHSGVDLIEQTVSYLKLTGAAFWFIGAPAQVSDRTMPIEIYCVSPNYVTPVRTKEKLIDHYIYSVNGQRKKVEPDEVIYFWDFNPESMTVGSSPLRALGATLELADAARKWNVSFFRNGALPMVLLRSRGMMGDNEIKAFLKQWNDDLQGTDKAFNTKFLVGGDIEVDQIAQQTKNMQFTDLLEYTREEILAAMGVPPSVVGIFKDSNYAHADAAKQQFYRDSIFPMLSRLSEKLNSNLVPKVDSGVYVEFDTSNVPELQEDPAVKSQRLVNYVAIGIMTKNEARGELGLEAIPGLDEPTPSLLGGDGSDSGAAPDDQNRKAPDFEVVKAERIKRREKANQTIEHGTFATIRTLERKIATVFERQQSYLLERLNQISDDDLQGLNRTAKVYGYADLQDLLWAQWKWEETWHNQTKAEFAQMILSGITTGFVEIGHSEIIPDSVVERSVSQLSKMITLCDDTTKDVINRIILRGLSEGVGIHRIVSNIQEQFKFWTEGSAAPGSEEWRAMRIARTEAYSGFNAGKRTGWELADKEKAFVKEWNILGINTRAWHMAADGQQREHDEAFIVNGEKLMQPGDPHGSAENIINCQCTISHVRRP